MSGDEKSYSSSDNEPSIKKIKIKKVYKEINSLKKYIESLEEKIFLEINSIKKKINNVNNDGIIIPLKNKIFTDKEYSVKNVSNILLSHDITSIIKVIKIIYLPTSEHVLPIKIMPKDGRKSLYYFNEGWFVDDDNYVINTLCNNIQKIFMNVNDPDNFDNDDEFMKNQDFILKICDNKYKQLILKKIKEELLTN
jgi:hypothetical protein